MTFDQELEALRPKLRAHCRRLLPYSREDAEDLEQETYRKAWAARSTYSAELPLANWLFRIACRLKSDYHRNRGRRPVTLSVEDAGLSLGQDLWDLRADPVDHHAAWQDEEFAAQMRRVALSRLTADNARVMTLFCAGLDYAEIAEEMGIPIGTVRSRMHRSRLVLSIGRCRK